MLGHRDDSQSKARLLSTIMDLGRVESIKQMNVGDNGNNCKIFVESNLDALKRKRRKKITIIRKRTHRDGSIESVK